MILPEMKKFLVFIIGLICCIGTPNAAVRDGTAISRNTNSAKQPQVRTATTPRRTSVARTQRALSSRTATNTKVVSERNARAATPPTSARTATTKTPVRASSSKIISRAATNRASAVSETRTGAEYEQCKNTYFACMDQFCTLKNDSYRRCSCNDRVFDLDDTRKTLEDAGEQITIFNENLQVVGMTAAQATSIRTASEGEDALTADKSASKALLQAIMNSITGKDTNVSGKYSDLNSINMSFDTSGSFDTIGAGQAIATYNGLALYNAVYPQCRDAVRADCNDASLQRAINAYLMAIEQDCNTVQTALDNTKKQVKSAIRESSASLDLARIENRQKHNSSDISTCINEVETAILSEEVCGANYHKCLDNGEYIDIDTGAPIAGVKDFFKLEQTLVFTSGIEAVHQKLAQNPSNRTFVENFAKRTKKYAEPALDKCVENADTVWSEYLDKAMLAIYYAQKDKVSEIKQNCFNYISECYINNNSAIDGATSGLDSDNKTTLQTDIISLNSQMCSDYIESCNNMFSNNIIDDYIENRDETDTVTACRAVVKQCFDKFGGTNYENFTNPNSGLFEFGRAIDWFTLYHYTYQNQELTKAPQYVSQCAQQLTQIDACNDPDLIEKVFGGMDSFITNKFLSTSFYLANPDLVCDASKFNEKYEYYACVNNQSSYTYGLLKDDTSKQLIHRNKRPTGVASEIYNQIISRLTTQCTNKQGRFLEPQSSTFAYALPYKADVCAYTRTGSGTTSSHGLAWLENICPAKYQEQVDTASWGMCSCWHNGGRRSRWGTTESCLPILPIGFPDQEDSKYTSITKNGTSDDGRDKYTLKWTRIKDIKFNDIPCSQIHDAISDDVKYSKSEATVKETIKNICTGYKKETNESGTETTTCTAYAIGVCTEYETDENSNQIELTTADNDIKYVCKTYKATPPFATVVNSADDPGARIFASYDKSGVSDMWCTQDQISKFDQVCSYTGIDDSGECNAVEIQQGDQYNGAQYEEYGDNASWKGEMINVSNLVPTGTNVKTSQ